VFRSVLRLLCFADKMLYLDKITAYSVKLSVKNFWRRFRIFSESVVLFIKCCNVQEWASSRIIVGNRS
jgi:hypothetical protein